LALVASADRDAAEGKPTRLGLRGLLGTRGFRRLLAVRFSAQWGDGMFQAALGGAVLFNPEREADPIAVAIGLAVLLLPYSIVGPFAGALLDRWDRRQVLWMANAVRVVLIVGVAGMVAGGVLGPPLYLGALAVTGVTRFVMAGLSASLPHVVTARHLVEANSVAATAGAAVAAIGGACAIGLRAVFGPGDTGMAAVTAVAAVGALTAAGSGRTSPTSPAVRCSRWPAACSTGGERWRPAPARPRRSWPWSRTGWPTACAPC
jgi:MFS family permease